MTIAISPAPDTPEHPLAPQPIDAPRLLRRLEQRIRTLKRALARNHLDEAWWASFGMTAPDAQERKDVMRRIANILNVDRATQRGKLHGFASMEDQRAWLARWEVHSCARAAWLAGVPSSATLVKLRAGEVIDAEPPG